MSEPEIKRDDCRDVPQCSPWECPQWVTTGDGRWGCCALASDADGDPCFPAIRRMVAELEKANAIIAKLPKTADGVPIKHLDRVWFKQFGKRTVDAGIAQMVVEERELIDRDTDAWGHVCYHGNAGCYSTRTAALAAIAAKDGER